MFEEMDGRDIRLISSSQWIVSSAWLGIAYCGIDTGLGEDLRLGSCNPFLCLLVDLGVGLYSRWRFVDAGL